MSTPLSQEYFEKYLEERLQVTTNTILDVVHQGFVANDARFTDHDARLQRIESTLATLVESVDRFAKIYTDLNQEVVVMRQQLRDVEERVGKLELKLKSA